MSFPSFSEGLFLWEEAFLLFLSHLNPTFRTSTCTFSLSLSLTNHELLSHSMSSAGGLLDIWHSLRSQQSAGICYQLMWNCDSTSQLISGNGRHAHLSATPWPSHCMAQFTALKSIGHPNTTSNDFPDQPLPWLSQWTSMDIYKQWFPWSAIALPQPIDFHGHTNLSQQDMTASTQTKHGIH